MLISRNTMVYILQLIEYNLQLTNYENNYLQLHGL